MNRIFWIVFFFQLYFLFACSRNLRGDESNKQLRALSQSMLEKTLKASHDDGSKKNSHDDGSEGDDEENDEGDDGSDGADDGDDQVPDESGDEDDYYYDPDGKGANSAATDEEADVDTDEGGRRLQSFSNFKNYANAAKRPGIIIFIKSITSL